MAVVRWIGIALGTVLAIVPVSGASAQAEPMAAAQTAAAATARPLVQLGPEQVVLGPSAEIDIPYSTLRDSSGTLHGFEANAASWDYQVISGGALTAGRKIFSSGATGAIDQCGAHILDPYAATSTHWVALYHGERALPSDDGACVWSGNHTQWSLEYVESFDAGKTWKKSGAALTQDAALMGSPLTDDAGSGWVVPRGQYFYLFFQATDATGKRGLNVARAPIASFGKPGTWLKWYCPDPSNQTTCGFTEPGLGGHSTQIANIPGPARAITWSSYLQRWVAAYMTGHKGLQLWMSNGDDFKSWNAVDAQTLYPPVSSETDARIDAWGRYVPSSGQVYGYVSLIGMNGSSSAVGQNLWVYYMKVYPGGGFAKRYLIRRELSFVPTTGIPLSRVQLGTYTNSQGRRFTSTEAPPPTWNYRRRGSAGFLLGAAHDGYSALFDCRTAAGDDYLARGCPGTPVRRVGWIADNPTTDATVPLYSCRNQARNDRYEATSCGSDEVLWRLGDVLKGVAALTYPLDAAFPAPTPVKTQPAVKHVDSLTRLTRVKVGAHAWKVSVLVKKNGSRWPNRLVMVQIKRPSGWRTIASVRTGSTGWARWRGQGKGAHRFYLKPSGPFPARASSTFRVPRRP